MISIILGIGISQMVPLSLYSEMGSEFQPRILSTNRICILKIDADWIDATRLSTEPNSGPAKVMIVPAAVMESNSAEPLAGFTLVALKKQEAEVKKLRGKYLAHVSEPRPNGHLIFNLMAQPSDVILHTAIRLPESGFALKQDEEPVVTFYRALSLTWKDMPIKALSDAIQMLPTLAPDDTQPVRTVLTTEAKAVLDLAADLDSVRKLLVLSELKRHRFRPVARLIHDAVIEAKDNPAVDEITLHIGLADQGLPGPGDFRVDNADFIAKASECSRDGARAFFIMNLVGVRFDGKKLASLLTSSGALAKYEIVRKLGLQSKQPELYIHLVPREEREAETARLVEYWKKRFGF